MARIGPRSARPKELPLAHIRKERAGEFAYYPALKKTFVAAEGKEERVRFATYNLLISKYGYPANRVDVQVPVKIRDDEQPRFADIVVYDDDDHKRPLIVVEVKRPHRQDGERQAQRYATILRAVYTLWNNGTDPMSASVLVNRYPEEAVNIPDIPQFGGEPHYKIQKLNPFSDDNATATAIRKCHNLIRSLDNKKPDQAFDEFLKILLVKFKDELRGGDYEFQILLRGTPPEPEDPNATAQRIRALFYHAVVEDADIASVFSEHEDINLKNETLVQIAKILQPYSFSSTDVDYKARAFETFLSGDLRQELKEFMTPRAVVEAVVAMAEPKPSDHILDPCCGSAAFLILALRYVRSAIQGRKLSPQQTARLIFDFAHDHLWGMDSSRQMANVGRLNMLVNEDGRAHIFHVQDSLNPMADAPSVMQNRKFDLIMTNPPFGQRITGPAHLLKTFGVTERYAERDGGFLSEILFVERNLDWLKPGGRMFIVLPDSVLGNKSLAAARLFIEQRARLAAVFSLPADTFGPSGAKSKTSVVLLEKRAEVAENVSEEDEVFLADVRHIGYDFTGRQTPQANQMPLVVDAFLAWKGGALTPGSPDLVRVVPRSALGKVWLAAPAFSKRASSPVKQRKGRADHWTLEETCSEIGIGKTASRAEYTNAGVHVVKVGNLTGRGIQWGCVERQFVQPNWVIRYPSTVLQERDILFTAAAHGPKWIGLKVDVFTHVPPRYGKQAVYCAEIMRVRINPEMELDPLYVLTFLRSAAGYAEIQRCIRGQSGHVYREQVREIRIPKPDTRSIKRVEDAIEALTRSLKSQDDIQIALAEADALAAQLFPSSVRKPIIAR